MLLVGFLVTQQTKTWLAEACDYSPIMASFTGNTELYSKLNPNKSTAPVLQDQKSNVLEGNETSEGTRGEMIGCTISN